MAHKKKGLFYLISPIHVISAVCAYRSLHPKLDEKIDIYFYWPGLNRQTASEIARIMQQMLGKEKYLSGFNLLTDDDISRFNHELEYDQYQEIYYAHEIVSDFLPTITQFNQKAKLICFGDPLGTIYDKNLHLGLLTEKATMRQKINWILLSIYKHIGSSASLKEKIKVYPNLYAQILPIFQSKSVIRRIPRLICNKKLVVETLKKCSSNCLDLQNYCQKLSTTYNHAYLLLTENYSEGNFLEKNAEIEYWAYIVRKYCKKHSSIIIKPHPAETYSRASILKDLLGSDYRVIEVDHKYIRYPIELWGSALTKYTILSSSFPLVSLKYLYGIDVRLIMDKASIHAWFPSWTWQSYQFCLSLYTEPRRRLNKWNGKSILYIGKPPLLYRITSS